MLRFLIALCIALLSMSIYFDVVLKGQSLLESIIGNVIGMTIGWYAGKLLAKVL